MEWHTASKSVMPASHSAMTCAPVSAAYSRQSTRRGLANLGCQLLVRRSGRLGEENLAAADRQAGQDGHEQRDDAHAADPLGHGAPEEDATPVGGKVREDGRSGRRQAGHRLEERVDEAEAGPDIRQRGEVRDDHPRAGHDEHAFDAAQTFGRVLGRLAAGKPHRVTQRARAQRGQRERDARHAIRDRGRRRAPPAGTSGRTAARGRRRRARQPRDASGAVPVKKVRTSSAAALVEKTRSRSPPSRRSAPRGTMACRAAEDGADDAVARRIEILEGPADEPGRDFELEDAAFALLEDGEQAGGAAFDFVQHRGDRGPACRDRDVDADALEEAQVRRLADARDDALDPELAAEQRRQEVAARRCRSPQTMTSLRPMSSDSSSARSVPSPLSTSARCSRAARISPRLWSRSMIRSEIDDTALSSRSARRKPTSPPPMMVTAWRSTFRPTVIRRCTSAIASGVPITTDLVAGRETRVAARDEEGLAARARRRGASRGQVQIGRRARRRAASRRRAGTRAAGRRRRQRLRRRSRPASRRCARCRRRAALPATPRDRCRSAPVRPRPPTAAGSPRATRNRSSRVSRIWVAIAAGDDVDFVESGAGDEDVGPFDAGAAQRLSGSCPASDELDVELLEAVRRLGGVIDDHDFVAGCQRLRETVADLPAADDQDAHDEGSPTTGRRSHAVIRRAHLLDARPLRVGHRHHRQPRQPHERKRRERLVGLDRGERHRLRQLLHRHDIDSVELAGRVRRIRIRVARRLHDADDGLLCAGVIEEDAIALGDRLAGASARAGSAPPSRWSCRRATSAS